MRQLSAKEYEKQLQNGKLPVGYKQQPLIKRKNPNNPVKVESNDPVKKQTTYIERRSFKQYQGKNETLSLLNSLVSNETWGVFFLYESSRW